MSQSVPKALQDAIDALAKLPGVGPRSAERYAYFLLKNPSQATKDIATAIGGLHAGVKECPITFALISSDLKVSPLYDDPRRNKQVVAVVAEPYDILALEKTGAYHGTYHVLGGLISPIDGVSPGQLHIKELIKRIDKDNVEEIILATNASVEGESTALHITHEIGKRKVKISRLARGLPIGIDLEYADQITLTRALEGRQLI